MAPISALFFYALERFKDLLIDVLVHTMKTYLVTKVKKLIVKFRT